MKNQFNAKVLLTVLSTLALITSCGKSGNKVNTYSGVSAFSTSNSAFNTSTGSTIVSQYQSIKNSVPCSTGTRLTKDVNFYASSGSVAGNTLYARNWIAGFSNAGTVNKMWVGVGYYRDLMFVTQLVNASGSVVGFNVTLSLCPITNSYTGTSIISDLTNFPYFSTPNGITMGSATSTCAYNMITAAINTALGYQSTTGASSYITTTFAPLGCK